MPALIQKHPRHLPNLLHLRSALVVALVLAACKSPTSPPRQQPLLTSLPRPLSVAETKVVGAANEFTFSWFQRLNAAVPADSSVFVSPLSASMSLGMAMLGAEGTGYDEMRSTLGFGNADDAAVRQGYGTLISLLRGLDKTVDFRIANSIWYRDGFPFHGSYLDTTKKYFDAEVRGLDFTNATASLATINGWVNEKTNARIPKILNDIDPLDVMFLINAIYFKGSWRSRFDPAATRDATFHGVHGDQPVRLMQQRSSLPYHETEQFQAVDLPYGNGAFTMTVVLPKPGVSVDELASGLTAATWAGWTAAFDTTELLLYLPKLKLKYERSLNDDLRAMGMNAAFHAPPGVFTRMSPAGEELFIAFVKQNTYVDVHEEGTEAAAVTVTGIRAVSAPPMMRVDRPYIFAIRERLSGTVLFIGKIVAMPPA